MRRRGWALLGPVFGLSSLAAPQPAPRLGAEAFDLLIRGGDVIDGSGGAARRADVGIRGDTIAAVGDLSSAAGTRVMNAGGLTVAPGFIDMHSHSDYSLLVDGRAWSKVTQGVTTELLGESESAGPITALNRDAIARTLAGLGVSLDWSTLAGYFDRLERGKISVNVASAVASGTVRAAVVGYDDRLATARELKEMEDLVEEAMRSGAVGLSSGLDYVPNRFASTEELIALARVAGRHQGIYVSHLRGAADDLLGALNEAIRIGREARIPVEVLHIKRALVGGGGTSGRQDTATLQDAVALLERAQRDGVAIYADVYPYIAAQTGLADRMIPVWAQEGGARRMVERIRDLDQRPRIVAATRGLVANGIREDRIMLSHTAYEPHRRFQGQRIGDIARTMGLEPAEAIVELVDRAEGRVDAIYFVMREEDVEYALRLPWTTIGSDGAAMSSTDRVGGESAHPRSYGTFPRILGHYVRDRKILELPDAIRKMTSLAASRLGLTDRGLLSPGMKADVVVFDPATIADHATYEQPMQRSTGVRWVVVNGQVVLEEGEHTGARPGRVLRRNHAAAGASAPPVPSAPPVDPVDEFVHAEMERQHIPGLSLAVVRDGAMIKTQGYGLANVELAVPAEADTVYQLGSISKQFIAAGIMLLAEEGRMKLDASIREYLPDAPETWKAITIRHLLTHTSGLVQNDPLGLYEPARETQVLKAIAPLNLSSEPGEQFSYSNAGYNILALALEKVAGQRWDEFLSERVFKPLGMSATRRFSLTDIVERRAATYAFKAVLSNISPTPRDLAAGGLLTTVGDLAKWDIALYGEKVLRRDSIDQMFTPAKLKDGTPAAFQGAGYGFGWQVGALDGRRFVAHVGTRFGSVAYVIRYLDQHLGIAVMSNLDATRAMPIATGVARLYLKGEKSR